MLEDHTRLGPEFRRRRAQAGFSIVELLAVLAIIGAIVAMTIPLVNEQVRIAEIRSITDEIAVHLRAARMIAVAQHRNVDVTISVDPTNTVSYTGANGETRLITMPGRVKIKSGSSVLIRFHSDGSSDATSTLTTESVVSKATERWTLTVSTVGMVSISHVRV